MPAQWLTTEECETLLCREVYGRLATCGRNYQPYITPVNFVYLQNRIYIHSGLEGLKLDNIADNPKVCFEISGAGELIDRPKACNFSIHRWSVLVFGEVESISDPNRKLAVLAALMEKYCAGSEYPPLTITDMQSVNVLAVHIDKISGKRY